MHIAKCQDNRLRASVACIDRTKVHTTCRYRHGRTHGGAAERNHCWIAHIACGADRQIPCLRTDGCWCKTDRYSCCELGTGSTCRKARVTTKREVRTIATVRESLTCYRIVNRQAYCLCACRIDIHCAMIHARC